MMNKKSLLIALNLTALCAMSNAYAYGGGNQSAAACNAPSFKLLEPASKSVASLAQFAIETSANINQKSVAVSVKRNPVKNLDISEQRGGKLLVKGTLEQPVNEGYARISINAETLYKCPGKEGWLIKIEKGE